MHVCNKVAVQALQYYQDITMCNYEVLTNFYFWISRVCSTHMCTHTLCVHEGPSGAHLVMPTSSLQLTTPDPNREEKLKYILCKTCSK